MVLHFAGNTRAVDGHAVDRYQRGRRCAASQFDAHGQPLQGTRRGSLTGTARNADAGALRFVRTT